MSSHLETLEGNPPTDGATGKPILRRQPGYYPGFSTLAQQNFWDEATRRVIHQRVEEIPPIRFFLPAEEATLLLVCEHILPQSDRLPETRIPILPFLDERLFLGRGPGYRFANMPPDGEAYRRGIQAIEQMAGKKFTRPFVELTWGEQEDLLKSIHDGKPLPGAEAIWETLPVDRFWALLVTDCIDVYYAHPFAWDEIGFGGPAYPRPYTRLENGEPEPWEVKEQRYEWIAPADTLSDPPESQAATHHEHPAHGQGGTH